ncbi:MAG TPA: methylated-DNA--[protein]-cysteine S-methyltransferase [Solirubrobacterales bacterium]|nr:methylated-DNA--[protein]-cysteine S-methyltransferase [Solirubrobacterales bacterium]
MSRVDAKRIGRVLGAGADAEEAAEAVRRFADRADREGLIEIAYASFDSPIGVGRVAASERGIVSVGLPNMAEGSFLEQLGELSPRILERPQRLDEALRELDQYFDGERHEFELALDWRLVGRGFAGKVLRETAKLPYGVTASYGEIAARAGNPRAYRAAGTALGHNPIPIVVPCHRILRAGNVLGNYGGGPEMKAFLLQLEGALPS